MNKSHAKCRHLLVESQTKEWLQSVDWKAQEVRWWDAVDQLQQIQSTCEDLLAEIPSSLRGSDLRDALQDICSVDFFDLCSDMDVHQLAYELLQKQKGK